MRFQLKYYECANDTVSMMAARGFIDLSDVESITQGLSLSIANSQSSSSSNGTGGGEVHNSSSSTSSTSQSLGKKGALAAATLSSLMNGTDIGGADTRSCFEVRTTKRVHVFCAKTPLDAARWVKQLQLSCLDS